MTTDNRHTIWIATGFAAGFLSIAPVYGQYTINTVAGNGAYGCSGGSGGVGDGGPATSASLCYPSAVAVDAAGNLYFSDGANRVRRVTPDGIISAVAGNGSFGCSGDGGPATSASLAQPAGVAVDGAGNLYIANTGYTPECWGWSIRKVAPGGAISTAVSQLYTESCSHPYNCNGLYAPGGVAVDGADNLYVADSGHNWILKGPSSGFVPVSTWPLPWVVAGDANAGSSGYSGDGGPALNALLASPERVAVDGSGNFYIADTYNQRIRKVTPEGIISTVAGNGDQGFSGDGGPATLASLNRPWDVAVDSAGNLYIADADNHRVRKVTPGGIISTIAGNGVAGYGGDGGPATSASLYGPYTVSQWIAPAESSSSTP